MNNWVRIFKTISKAEADIVKGMLKANGVPTSIEDKSIAGQTGTAIDAIYISVRSNDVDRAKSMIDR